MPASSDDTKTGPQRRRANSGQSLLDWESFWDITDPETACVYAIKLYGAMASGAAADCAIAALIDGRRDDYRFWSEVRDQGEVTQKMRREAAVARWDAVGLRVI